MATGENSVLGVPLSRGVALQSVIVVLAVATTTLLLTDSEFAILAASALFAVTAVLKFDWFVYAIVFFLPWNSPLDANMPVRDVSLVLHLALFLGVGIRIIKEGKSVRQWLFGSRLKKAIMLFLAVAVVSLLVP